MKSEGGGVAALLLLLLLLGRLTDALRPNFSCNNLSCLSESDSRVADVGGGAVGVFVVDAFGVFCLGNPCGLH